MAERWIVGLGILFGFLWIRSRAKAMRNRENHGHKAFYGVFLVLGPLLLLGKLGFDRLPFGRYSNLALELLGLALIFGVTGLVFLRPRLDPDGKNEKRDA